MSISNGAAAIFLDRDGTLIEDPGYLNDPAQVQFCAGAIEALIRLGGAGFLLIVVTNQSGIPRGLVQEENLQRIHERIQDELNRHGVKILEFLHSPHLPESNHPWRKPNPGMLLHAIRKFNIDPQKSWMIGDRASDVEAGQRAEVATVLIHLTDQPIPPTDSPPTLVVKSLYEAANKILDSSS